MRHMVYSTINIAATTVNNLIIYFMYFIVVILRPCVFHLATWQWSWVKVNYLTQFTFIQYWMSIRGDHTAAVRGIKSFLGNHRSTCLFCSRYWAFWIWSCVPVMVMMRSSEPSSGSSILMDAPDSWRICLILWPPLPMMEPASCKTLKTDLGAKCLFCHSLPQELLVLFF